MDNQDIERSFFITYYGIDGIKRSPEKRIG